MENDKLLPPGKAAEILGVSTKTLSRWSDEGKIPFIRTLGGHRRYRASVVLALIA
jgi:excisionase family DNA binding protein